MDARGGKGMCHGSGRACSLLTAHCSMFLQPDGRAAVHTRLGWPEMDFGRHFRYFAQVPHTNAFISTHAYRSRVVYRITPLTPPPQNTVHMCDCTRIRIRGWTRGPAPAIRTRSGESCQAQNISNSGVMKHFTTTNEGAFQSNRLRHSGV